MATNKPRYCVTTWDMNRQEWTPQVGVRTGPYTQFGLRKALRALQRMSYDTRRSVAVSVLVERIE